MAYGRIPRYFIQKSQAPINVSADGGWRRRKQQTEAMKYKCQDADLAKCSEGFRRGAADESTKSENLWNPAHPDKEIKVPGNICVDLGEGGGSEGSQGIQNTDFEIWT